MYYSVKASNPKFARELLDLYIKELSDISSYSNVNYYKSNRSIIN